MTDKAVFCQICRGPWPDGHEPWCPVLTGEPQLGNNFYVVQFIGGPLDGLNPVHPTQNSILWVPGYLDMQYVYRFDGRYHWEQR